MTATAEHAYAPAYAKVNLSLHVQGRRDDGYHLLQSIVAFADVADRLTFEKSPVFTLRMSGPFARDLPKGKDNIVVAAAEALADRFAEVPRGALIVLEKNLPVASGIGGGSANAAACLRGLERLAGAALPETAVLELALSLGADVPVCMRSKISLMSGIGDVVEPLPDLPPVHCVLVNPRVGVPTGPVFQALGLLQGVVVNAEPPAPPVAPFADAQELAAYLATCRNDLEAPAMQIVREIGDVQEALFATEGCLLARMSGSGATCFGLYASADEASAAAARLEDAHSSWWTGSGRLF